MTAAELLYLLAGVAVGITATLTYQRQRHRAEHRRAKAHVDRRLASVTRLPARGWHPSQHGDSA